MKARASKYAFLNGVLYRRSFLGPYQGCLPSDEAKRIFKQIHGGICGTHIGGRALCHKIMMQGFYWPTMKQESELFVKNCDTCKKFDNAIHALAITLPSMSSP